MEVPNNYSIRASIDMSRKLQQLMGDFRAIFEALADSLELSKSERLVASLKLWLELRKKTGYGHSGWKEKFGKLAKRLEALKYSDGKAPKYFKSHHLVSLIKKLEKLSGYCKEMKTVLKKSDINAEIRERLWSTLKHFKANLDGLIILLKELQI